MVRHEKGLESARTELADLHTALRVMAAITGESVADSTGTPGLALSTRHADIIDLLKVGSENAQAPVQVFEAYTLIASDVINADTFRTTIWRMKDKYFPTATGVFVVRSDEGKYWKELRAEQTVRDETEAPAAVPAGAPGSGWGVQPPHPFVVKPNPWPAAVESE
ncbi:MAG: hypothetical protein ABIR77_00125 [Sphingomicrobium sp.]